MTPELSSNSPLDPVAPPASRMTRFVVILLRPKVAFSLLGMLMVLMAPLIYRGIKLSRVPPADEPFDIKSVLNFAVPDSDNAFVEYRAATALVVPWRANASDPQKSNEEFDKAISDGWQYATEPVRQWLDANRPFMELWRKGTAKREAQYIRAGDMTIETLLPVVQETRTFARLVRLEASRLLSEGQPDESWDWLRASFRTSRHHGRHGCLIERLIGIAVHAVTAEGMVKWANDPQVNADRLRRAIQELQAEQQHITPLSKCLQIEYLTLMSTINSDSVSSALDLSRFEGSSFVGGSFFFINGKPELGERVARHAFANWLTQADKPRQGRPPYDPSALFFEPDPTISKHQFSTGELHTFLMESILTRRLLPAGKQIFVAADRESARDKMLLTVLALELFAREHGHYPDKLEELVPDSLPTLPEDIYAPAKTLPRYRRDGDSALIYSTGDNGIDDGGLFEKAEDIGYRIGKPPSQKPE